MCEWFEQLLTRAPDFGYFPEPVLVVGPSDVQQATALFGDLGIKVVSGSCLLDGFIGDRALVDASVSKKFQLSSQCVQTLSDVAVHQPQATHAALARSLQFGIPS